MPPDRIVYNELTVAISSPTASAYSLASPVNLSGTISPLGSGQVVTSICYQLMNITKDSTGQPQSITKWVTDGKTVSFGPININNGTNLSPGLTYSITVFAADNSKPVSLFSSTATTFTTTP